MEDAFSKSLEKYAEVILRYGVNLQSGQGLHITSEAFHRDFVVLLTEMAYKMGAKYVSVDLSDPRTTRARVNYAAENSLSFVPAYNEEKYKELLRSGVAFCNILGPEDPLVLVGADPRRLSTIRAARYESMREFYETGIGRSHVQWAIAAAATPEWAARVFGVKASKDAERRLWEVIFSLSRVDHDDPCAAWREHNHKLHARAHKLTEMNVESFRFLGPGTDLTVGFSKKAIFKGGTDCTPQGVEFEPNLPTEEVYTTPDWRRTSGNVRATRPFFVNGSLIEELEMTFQDGEIIDFSAKNGQEAFRAHIETDDGARRLGEVALVGIDSPVYQSGLVFQEILFDENAACHIAIGSAYKFCIEGGSDLDKKGLQALGCNESVIHTDIMISSEEVSVFAVLGDGSEVKIIENGEWKV